MFTRVHIDLRVIEIAANVALFTCAVAAVILSAWALEALIRYARRRFRWLGRSFFGPFEFFLPSFLIIDLLVLLAYRVLEAAQYVQWDA